MEGSQGFIGTGNWDGGIRETTIQIIVKSEIYSDSKYTIYSIMIISIGNKLFLFIKILILFIKILFLFIKKVVFIKKIIFINKIIFI